MASVMARDSHLIEFLDMLAAERGASPNTIEAYGSDLDGFLEYLSEAGVGPLAATARHIQCYIATMANAGQASTSRSPITSGRDGCQLGLLSLSIKRARTPSLKSG